MTIAQAIAPITSPFRADGIVTVADVLVRAEAELEGTAQRDTRSAFRCLVSKLGIDPETVPATPKALREILGPLTPGMLGVSGKRLANIRSLVTRAVERFGMARRVLIRDGCLTPDWEALLDRAEPQAYRYGLSRFARFCSAARVAPDTVDMETLRAFHEALEAECMVKHPQAVLKHTISHWNMQRRRVAGWPRIALSTPFARGFDTLPLKAFPESFQSEISSWADAMRHPDPLDPEAPVRTLREPTIKGYIVVFRRFASALVHRGVLPIREITGLAVFFEGDNVKAGLRHFLPEGGAKTTRYAHDMARKLSHIARHHLRLPADEMERIDAIVARLDPNLPRGMGKRHRDRLDQFDDPATVRRLLQFPADERDRALAMTSPIRRARGIERALAISVLIQTGLRIRNLRQLRLDRSVRRAGGRVYLEIADGETKTGMALTLELPSETTALLDAFTGLHRPLLPGSDSPFLFPGRTGGARSDNAMRAAVSEPLRRHAGIVINPHLYRHAIAKIVVERDPGMYVAISRRLGHRSLNTTLGSYLGTETRAASRQINRLLDRARSRPEIED
ncbi:hypothetical protein LNKW23_48550 [Paralimibaculum aggregatum]|uniref:Tyr recombinase domain-containing protein n=1 Tax=Paralimibaculum aggregatum TaxID=3036245 RepID=A0ABQ6LUB2_9RHOB|nr:tyrosine-type recombinase/integrase [Limibaculum sp. NKW23]GMG85632.1 hypothetical protein LNKW23_48550 [Limibaculum sp. NKW23]